jgi:two-component system response regulator
VPAPDIILLDLKMPRKNGCEVLAELKADPRFAQIPVAIVTVSEGEGEILKAYNLGVDCYITKPIDVTKFMKVARSIPHFQVTVVTTSPAA